ncbi:MAG TPA: hypothetical protein VL915_02115, partial [Gemmatimonadales bacterium]|nr:hypothetical protein [Gemmatimonadales bacterium]
MIKKLIESVFGTRHEREVKRLQPLLDAIHREEEKLKDLTEEQLRGQTAKFREIIAERTGALRAELDQAKQAKHDCADPAERDTIEDRVQQLDQQYRKAIAQVLDDLLPEAYATVRE